MLIAFSDTATFEVGRGLVFVLDEQLNAKMQLRMRNAIENLFISGEQESISAIERLAGTSRWNRNGLSARPVRDCKRLSIGDILAV